MSETLTTTTLTVTAAAQATILEAREGELDSGSLALWLEVGGTTNGRFAYEMYFQPLSELSGTDIVVEAGPDLKVVIPASSIEKLQGSTLDLAADGSGMMLTNPNEPKAAPPAEPVEITGSLDGPVAARIMVLLEQEVNPGLASHGGYASLVSLDGDTAFISMGGGCQGCAMSKATLRQGIEVAIKKSVPEIVTIVDVTDHATGATPYYS